MSDSLWPHELQHSRPPCPSPTPGVHSNSCPLSWWCHPAISSSVVPLSSCPQSLQASESFPMSQLFAWGGQSIGVSALASILPMNTQDWSPLEWSGCISLNFRCVDLSLGFLFCSTDLYFCLCASTILSWWLWLCSRALSQAGWFLQFHSSFSRLFWLFKVFFYFHTNCEIICSSSVKNAVGSLIGIALNL